MTKEQSNYTVTPQTAGFVDTLKALERLKDAYSDALAAQYGEEQGEKLYFDELPAIEAVADSIAKYLTISITMNFTRATINGTAPTQI